MTHHSPRRKHTAAWTLVTILLVIAVAGTLVVPVYARSTPALGGFPFFYWYQLLWVPVVGILAGIAYFALRPADATAARQGTQATPVSGPDDAGGAL
jgi:hypothetical protein